MIGLSQGLRETRRRLPTTKSTLGNSLYGESTAPGDLTDECVITQPAACRRPSCAASPSDRRTELRCDGPGAGGEVNLSEAVFSAVGRMAASDHGFSSFPRWPLD